LTERNRIENRPSRKRSNGVSRSMFMNHAIMYIQRGYDMPTSTLRHKHVRIDQAKLNRAKRILNAETETEALDRALDVVVAEARIDRALRSVRGKGRLRKVFR